MSLPQDNIYYTVDDFYNLPDDIHAELINGRIVYMATPSRLHQDISHELDFAITSYIKSKGGKCRVYTAPFSVQLHEGEDTLLEPDISVICDTSKLTSRGCIGAPDWIIYIHVYNLESGGLKLYSFKDTVKAGIYEDPYIDFSSLDI